VRAEFEELGSAVVDCLFSRTWFELSREGVILRFRARRWEFAELLPRADAQMAGAY
jgi:hypothetical protein